MGSFSSFCPLSPTLPPFHLHSLLPGVPQLCFLFQCFPGGRWSGHLGASPQVFKHHGLTTASGLSQTASAPPPSLISVAGIPVITAAHSSRKTGCGSAGLLLPNGDSALFPSCGVLAADVSAQSVFGSYTWWRKHTWPHIMPLSWWQPVSSDGSV